MPRRADVQQQLTDAHLPQAAGIVDDAATRDAAVEGLEAHATARHTPIRRVLRARQGPAPRLLRRHDDGDQGERTRQAAEILESSAAWRPGVWGRLGHPLIVGAAGIGLTAQEDRACRMEQQDVVDRVAPVLATITARLLNGILGALEAALGPVVPNRGEGGAEAGAAAGGPDGLGRASGGTTHARASAAVTPRRFASAVKDRVGASPRARRVARRTTKST